MSPSERLVFVYNADSGLVNALRDVWHRVASPSTYPCRLCKVTYGASGMRRDWRAFTAGLGLPVDFLHRDEFRATYGSAATEVELPVVLLEDSGSLKVVVTAAQLRGTEDVAELERLVTSGLAAQRR